MHLPTLPVRSRRLPTGIVVYLSVTHLTKLSRLNAPKAAMTRAVRLQNWRQSFTFSVGGGTLAQALNRTATDDISSHVALPQCEDFCVGEKIDRIRFIAVLSRWLLTTAWVGQRNHDIAKTS